jgi:hypothetical protein
MIAYLPQSQNSCLSSSSSFLLSLNLGTRFLLRGVGLSHPEISNFRMWIERIIKEQFSHNFKTFPIFIFLYRKYSIGKTLVWFSESNKRLWVLHSCWCILVLPECKRFCRCFRPANLPRGTRCSRLCGEDRDRETENSKVCVRTRDTRFIQVRVAKVANPTSGLGDQVWRPALGVGCPRRDWVCAARYPALPYIVQGAGA